MTPWRELLIRRGAARLPDGTLVAEGIEFREADDHEGKYRFTYTIDGKSVTHTFDMKARWDKRHGSQH